MVSRRLLACLSLLPSLAALAAPPPGEGYRLVFEDNFDSGRVDESFWDYRVGRRGGEDPTAGWIYALNRRENVTVSDGHMRIRHAQETISGKLENTCGGLISKRRFGYGYYETRLKPFMITTPGTHAAFWQFGVDRQPGLAGQDPTRPASNRVIEIDSAEISSPSWHGTNNIYIHLIPEGSRSILWPHRSFIPVQPDAEGFFVDGYEFRPDGVIFYDNGREVARTGYSQFYAQQEVWLTSLAGAHHKEMDASQLPGEALFDYFRYYAKDWPGANLLGNPGFEYNLTVVDPQLPMAWLEQGDEAASYVARGAAHRDHAKLRHASDRAYSVATSQTLQHLLDGTYSASAWVRSSGGQKTAALRVYANGAGEKSVPIPASSEWTLVQIPEVEVRGGSVTIGVESQASAWQWLEVDGIAFYKPAHPGAPVNEAAPFRVPDDPFFSLFPGSLQNFADQRYYLFPRDTGSAPAISVAFALRAERLADETPIDKQPASGESGWSIRLTAAGDIVALIGSEASHATLVAPNAYAPGRLVHVAFVFDRGSATLYVDSQPVATRSGITQRTDDLGAPGGVGVLWGKGQRQTFSGSLGDLRIHHRALSAEEIAPLVRR
jgi:Concanavalin A-like lectin/glucanases superfamily/Glycosyl hydrolases family 16